MPGYMRDLGNGKYQFEVSAGRKGSGGRDKRYKTITARGKTLEAKQKYAEKQLAHFMAEVESGNNIKPTKLTFSDYVDKWRIKAERDLAPKTYYRYNELLKLHILPQIGAYKLEDINVLIIEDAYNELRKPIKREYTLKSGKKKVKEYTLSEQTLKHIHRLISTILQTAFRKELIRENPITRVDAPKVKKTEPPSYDEEQIATLIEALEDTELQFKTAAHIALASGCRLGELNGLDWINVDYPKSTIEIKKAGQYLPDRGTFTKDPKNEKSKRIVSLPSPVMDLIAQLEHEKKLLKLKLGNKWKGGSFKDEEANPREDLKPNRLFTQADGSPIFPTTLSQQWSKFVKEKGLPKITFHGLRHTSISYLIACGHDVASIAKRAGHSTPNTTLGMYTHAFKKQDEVAASYMDKLYVKKNKKPDTAKHS
jgi:integrase